MSGGLEDEKIALIGGTGDLGFGLAARWARAGIEVLIGSREESKARQAAERLRAMAGSPRLPENLPGIVVEGYSNAEAAARASVVVLAVPFPAQVAIVKSIRGALKDAIVVDTTVPLAATLGGKATRLLGLWQGSAAEQTRELLPASTPVLAAFHSLSAEDLQNFSFTPDCDVLVCGDDERAKQKLCALIQLLDGLRPVDAGALEMARILEGLTALLISLNRKHQVRHCGIRITGLPTGS